MNVILAEERRVFDLVDATNVRAMAWVRPGEHTDAALGLSAQQHQVVTAIASTPQLVVPLSAPPARARPPRCGRCAPSSNAATPRG